VERTGRREDVEEGGWFGVAVKSAEEASPIAPEIVDAGVFKREELSPAVVGGLAEAEGLPPRTHPEVVVVVVVATLSDPQSSPQPRSMYILCLE